MSEPTENERSFHIQNQLLLMHHVQRDYKNERKTHEIFWKHDVWCAVLAEHI